MKRIGITGGIGSGKTTVCHEFAALGIPVYDSDTEAKRLMAGPLRSQIIALLGSRAFDGEALNREYTASVVFSNPELLERLDAVVHPAVAEDFAQWSQTQRAPYVIIESAILFESGFDRLVDKTIIVTAPVALRISRTVMRDATSEQSVAKRIANQSPEKYISRADYIINNLSLDDTRRQVAEIHNSVLNEK